MIETHASAPARVSGPAPSAPPAAAAGEKASGFSLWGDGEGFSFADLLDAVNPLQHIPVLGTLYRELTGDHIGTAAKLAGGALFAGIPGLIGSAVDSIVEALSGKDIGENVLALFDGGAARRRPPSLPPKRPRPNQAWQKPRFSRFVSIAKQNFIGKTTTFPRPTSLFFAF